MSGDRVARLHAVVCTLSEGNFLPAAIASVYDQVDGITVITTYDRDWSGNYWEADETLPILLSRDLDPERKISVIVSNETNEARSRNRAMDFAWPRRRSCRVKQQHSADDPLPQPDYFLILDTDEVWEHDALYQARRYIMRETRPIYEVSVYPYLGRWTVRVDADEWLTAFVRRDQRLNHLRDRRRALLRRGIASMGWIPTRLKDRVRNKWSIPPDIAWFHHGSYVGDRTRIEKKLQSFGHASEVAPDWLDRVWERWSPSMTDLHPVRPRSWPSASELAIDDLPAEIRDAAWPSGWL